MTQWIGYAGEGGGKGGGGGRAWAHDTRHAGKQAQKQNVDTCRRVCWMLGPLVTLACESLPG